MATRSRARHFHATAKALVAAADARGEVAPDLLLGAQVMDVDVAAIVAGAAAPTVEDELLAVEEFGASTTIELPQASIEPAALAKLHEEYRWADSKLMHASERLAEAQDARRKDLVALAIMRRELQATFAAESAWIEAALQVFGDIAPAMSAREFDLDALVAAGVRTASVIHELAVVRSERKLYELGAAQLQAQLGTIRDNASTMEYQVASESYEREPDGEHMREVARLRAASTRARRMSVQLRNEAREALELIGIATSVGDVAAAGSFLAGEYEGDERAAARMERVRKAQAERELELLPEPEAAWKAGLKHPVHFMRARRTTAPAR